MKIREVMKKEIYTIHPEATLKEIMEKLVKYKATGFVVVDDNDKIIGIVSEKDVYRTLYPSYEDFYKSPELFTDFEKQEKEIENKKDIPVKEFMTSEVMTIGPDENVMKAGAIMLAKGIHRFPVVDENGKLVGIASRGRIYRSLFRKYLGCCKPR